MSKLLNSLSYVELQELLKNHQITYRDSLGLPKDLTFGIEIEGVGVSSRKLQKLLSSSKWKVYSELSIKKETGAEASSPIFIDDPQTWQDIFNMCEFLKENNMDVSAETAAHIHFGNRGLIDNDPIKLLNIMKMWGAYESIIYRFSKGEFSNIREGVYEFARPIAKEIKKITLIEEIKNQNLRNMMGLLYFRRFCGLNIDNMYNYYKVMNGMPTDKERKAYKIKDTIEVRTPNGTLDQVVWQNNVNFFAKLLLYAISDEFDSEKIDAMLQELEFVETCLAGKLINLTYLDYMNVDMPLAIDLADTIFENEIDKLNFLKQYIGEKDKEKTLVLR